MSALSITLQCPSFCACVHVCVSAYTFVLPEVLSVSHVPGCGVTHHPASIIRLHKHGVVPEVIKHLHKTHRFKEFLCFFEQSNFRPVLKIKGTFGGRKFNSVFLFAAQSYSQMYFQLFHARVCVILSLALYFYHLFSMVRVSWCLSFFIVQRVSLLLS